MKTVLNRLTQHHTLDSEEAENILTGIAEGQYNPSQVAAFLTVFMMRSITLEELKGFRKALQKLCLAIDLSEFSPIDLCGTGGDGKDTFNISTLASFVTAGAGIKVAKHGNYGVSSGCGSSNVLEHLGIKFSNDSDFLKRCIDQAGICNLHAPLFHPAMKKVAPIRRELGVKTFFNMLGPLVNPAFPKHQLTGVFNLELARLYGYLFQKTDQNFTILYALDGYDEISLTGPAKAIRNQGEQLITAQDFGVAPLSEKQICGGDSIPSSAAIFTAVLDGKGTEAQNNVVCANAAMAIATATDCTPRQGFEKATAALQSGKAAKAFKTLQKLSAA
jgi:anthranilate phosphoribosyltransferase